MRNQVKNQFQNPAKYILILVLGSLAQLIVLYSIFSFFHCHSHNSDAPEAVITVGEYRISLSQFRTAYELDPSFPNIRKGKAALAEYAEVLADKQLCARLAREENLTDSLPLQRQMTQVRRKAIIQALFQKTIVPKVNISEAELREAFRKMNTEIHLYQLFSKDSLQAMQLYEALRNGTPFDTLAKEVFSRLPPEKGSADLGIVRFGDLDPALEDAAFRLKLGKFSRPIKSRNGYHILRVTERRENIFLTEDEFQVRKRSVFRVLKRRREETLAGKYLNTFLNPYKIRVKKSALLKIFNTLFPSKEKSAQPYLAGASAHFRDSDIRLLQQKLGSDLKQTFMQYKNGNWTIGDFLQKIAGLPEQNRPGLESLKKFNSDVGIFIRNEFLLSRAHNLGLDRSAAVDSSVNAFLADVAYQFYLKKFYSAMTVRTDVLDYYKFRSTGSGKPVPLPSDVFPRMQTLEHYKLYYAARRLHRFLQQRFPNVPVYINHQIFEEEARRIDWDRPLRMLVIPQQ